MTQENSATAVELDGDNSPVVPMRPTGSFTYDLDAGDRVSEVCPDWDPLAESFSQGGPRTNTLVGTSIYTHFTGRQCREIYRLLFERTRQQQARMIVPFRCDGPSIRRWMKLQIEPLDHRGLRVSSLLLQEEARPYTPLFDVSLPRSRSLLCVCAWCKRIETSYGWQEVEEAVGTLLLFAGAELPEISHGMCPACNIEVLNAP